MNWISPILFFLFFGTGVFLFVRHIGMIRRSIALGRPDLSTDQPGKRWGQVLRLALGQQKMFRNIPVAILHLIIYLGFIIINIEVLEIVLDGLTGSHRLFLEPLGPLYPVLINAFEWLALGVLVTCIVFLTRRTLIQVPRLRSTDLTGWPRKDANLILITEILLMTLFLFMNATDTLLQQRNVGHYAESLTGTFSISVYLHPMLQGLSDHSLVWIERCCWWLHILGILAFLNYLPYSKHLHILLAFPNAYYASLENKGKMTNMPAIQQEVLLAIDPGATIANSDQPPGRFGAKDVQDLGQKNLLDAFSCTECGRCSAACPAQQTGKLLSPRRIMMRTRDRMEDLQKRPAEQQEDDNRSLLHDYITVEELRACTTCQACVEVCPVSINPLDIILQLRRYLVMEESNAPGEWTGMFSNVENNFAPWKFSPDDRDNWSRSDN
ncbi:MAG: 4Fe-4S dicluster domain-containing protein [Bacteroidota bacterium]